MGRTRRDDLDHLRAERAGDHCVGPVTRDCDRVMGLDKIVRVEWIREYLGHIARRPYREGGHIGVLVRSNEYFDRFAKCVSRIRAVEPGFGGQCAGLGRRTLRRGRFCRRAGGGIGVRAGGRREDEGERGAEYEASEHGHPLFPAGHERSSFDCRPRRGPLRGAYAAAPGSISRVSGDHVAEGLPEIWSPPEPPSQRHPR